MQNKKYILLNNILLILIMAFIFGYLFGYKPFVVISNSMEPTIRKGDLIISKKQSRYEVDDVITFKSNNQFVTHRIIDKFKDHNSAEISFTTKGDANFSSDLKSISQKDIFGKVVTNISYIGYLITVLQFNVKNFI
ncbi:signal peptidase I [Candidatus Woesebacteria bacterium]|nr:signal peptidase I [Candidatus Woesebacteria bacterium]